MPTNITIPTLNNSQTAAKYIKFAADKTGVDFDYLLQTAKRESAFNPDAKATTSSATGLFQFIRQTWYETLQQHGEKYGYQNYSKHIKQDKAGRYFVPNQQAKIAILELRKDPKAASLMAAEFSKQNIQHLTKKIGRVPSAAETYMAHFMGRTGAATLINLNARVPDMKAVEVFPSQAAANKAIFFEKGQPRSVREVYENLANHHMKIAIKKGLDPKKIEDVVKLVPFLPNNDGFFGSLFGQQMANAVQKKQLAISNIGLLGNNNGQINNLLLAQIIGQKPNTLTNYSHSNNAKPLPEMLENQFDNASIAKQINFFSVTKK